jgi:hypothetical protein
MRLSTVIALAGMAALLAQTSAAPAFDEYPAPARYRGKPAVPRFGGDKPPDSDQRARETIEIQAEDGPNFAGHFTIARWSCDTGCFQIVVIDTPTGRLYRDMPFRTLDIGYNHDNEEHRYAGLSFRAASNLLIAEGCFDGEERTSRGEPQDCSRRYYKWDGTKFVLLKSVALEKD